jgi:uncharacterized cupredoxin-like copper-binding protein
MKRVLLVLMLGLPLILASCGGGGGTSTTINVTMTDFQFTPNTFSVPAGQQITVNATNNGAVVHNFVIMKPGTDIGPDYGPEDEPNALWKLEIQPGGQASDSFTAPADAGEYTVICTTPGHYMAGMQAKLIVK